MNINAKQIINYLFNLLQGYIDILEEKNINNILII